MSRINAEFPQFFETEQTCMWGASHIASNRFSGSIEFWRCSQSPFFDGLWANGGFILVRHKLRSVYFVTFLRHMKIQALLIEQYQDAHTLVAKTQAVKVKTTQEHVHDCDQS